MMPMRQMFMQPSSMLTKLILAGVVGFFLTTPVYAADVQGNPVSGNVAHDSPDLGKPVKLGLKAVSLGANPTSVGSLDRTDWYANRAGVPFIAPGHPNILTKEFHFTAGQTNTALVAGAANTRIIVTGVDAIVSKATSVNVGVRVGFAASALSAVSDAGVAGIVLSHPGLAAGSGIVKGNNGGTLGIGAAADAVLLTSDAPTDGALRVVVTYYTISEP
jgi:hypothetical protein